jgi:ubiquinone/menaquinone biosynthesis C-methylase UbiE
MVTAENTAKKYAGQMAANYEQKRSKQLRWKHENKAVQDILTRYHSKIKTILDAPVGTGRFLKVCNEFGFTVVGYDSSAEMLALAKRKRLAGKLLEADIRKLPDKSRSFDACLCVRLLDLIPEDAMQEVLTELCRVTKRYLILTIRLGDEYVAKVNTATHDARRFTALHQKLGFIVVEDVQIFKQGWHVLCLERKKNGILEHIKPRKSSAVDRRQVSARLP